MLKESLNKVARLLRGANANTQREPSLGFVCPTGSGASPTVKVFGAPIQLLT